MSVRTIGHMSAHVSGGPVSGVRAASATLTRLSDAHGRVARDLRVSVTDRCNLRCTYCMPAEGMDWIPGRDLLTDDEIIRLRTRIRQASEAKLQSGTYTVNDLLRDITAESLARQQKAIHEIQWLMRLYDWRHTLNN